MPRQDWEDSGTGEDTMGPATDFEFIRTLDGHIGINAFTDPDKAADFDWRRNTHSARKAVDPRKRK